MKKYAKKFKVSTETQYSMREIPLEHYELLKDNQYCYEV